MLGISGGAWLGRPTSLWGARSPRSVTVSACLTCHMFPSASQRPADGSPASWIRFRNDNKSGNNAPIITCREGYSHDYFSSLFCVNIRDGGRLKKKGLSKRLGGLSPLQEFDYHSLHSIIFHWESPVRRNTLKYTKHVIEKNVLDMIIFVFFIIITLSDPVFYIMFTPPQTNNIAKEMQYAICRCD